ncbi:hypothetical protein [Megavirus chiliensis]|nr:hypothetical protein MegaChil _gp1100 [Megavirus chiliensis]AEQ32935.1 hypothetical protein [Megavirus chiliensis]
MKIYIVWKTDHYGNMNNDLHNHIIGIYKNKNDAINKCIEYDKNFNKNNIESDDDGLLGEFSSIDNDTDIFCNAININNNDKKIYFLKVTEDGGSERYHMDHFLYALTSMTNVMYHVENWVDEEHNREKNCVKCNIYDKHLKYIKYKNNQKSKKYDHYKKYKIYENVDTDLEIDDDFDNDHNHSRIKICDRNDIKTRNCNNARLNKYKSYMKCFNKKNQYCLCKKKTIKDLFCSKKASIDCVYVTDIFFHIFSYSLI